MQEWFNWQSWKDCVPQGTASSNLALSASFCKFTSKYTGVSAKRIDFVLQNLHIASETVSELKNNGKTNKSQNQRRIYDLRTS